MRVFVTVIKGEEYPSQMKYPTVVCFLIYYFARILIDMNKKYIHFTIIDLKNPMRNFVFALIWILTIVTVIYVYPKVDIFVNMWNDYLMDL